MRKNWPEGVKMGVALTFDLDAETFWFSRTMDSLNRQRAHTVLKLACRGF